MMLHKISLAVFDILCTGTTDQVANILVLGIVGLTTQCPNLLSPDFCNLLTSLPNYAHITLSIWYLRGVETCIPA